MENQVSTTPIISTTPLPKKSNFLVVLLSILLFISLLITGFFAYQTQKLTKELVVLNNEQALVPSPTPDQVFSPELTAEQDATLDPTANWKTYVDSKFNYSFKFPDTWIDQTEINDKNLGNFSLKSNEEEWITGTVFTGTPDLENDKKNGGSSRSFVLNSQKYLFVAYVECMGPGCGASKKHLDTFNQILSTFKFTN